jgi:hypothetical protein
MNSLIALAAWLGLNALATRRLWQSRRRMRMAKG